MKTKLFLFIGLLLSLIGCSSHQPITLERVVLKTDTLYKTKVSTDTFRFHDSIYVETFTRGDTVFKTRVEWKWRDRTKVKVDTIYRMGVLSDSIRVPVPTAHKATWWEKTQMIIGKSFIVFCSLVLFALLLWIIHRKR